MNGHVGFVVTGLLAVVIGAALLQGRLPEPPPKAIGIDLGTTFSCVAIFNSTSGVSEVLPAPNGKRIVPSTVAVLPDGRTVAGHDALAALRDDPERTMFDAKRFLGRSYDSVAADTPLDLYPFTLVNRSGEPAFRLSVAGRTVEYSPVQVSAMVLGQLKANAEARLGSTVRRVVLAVPVEFDQRQRNATIEAATLAGLEVMRLVHEPTAAAMAYGLHQKEAVTNVLVYDFGGGTLDVSLLALEDSAFRVIARHGDNRLGGEDFNHALMSHVSRELLERHRVDVAHNHSLLEQLRLQVEDAKIALSEAFEATVELHTHSESTYRISVTRQEFEAVAVGLFERSMVPVKMVLDQAGVLPDQVDEIVLVGGSSRLPRVRELLRYMFGKELNSSVNPDEAVASGTAVQAGIMMDSKNIPVYALD